MKSATIQLVRAFYNNTKPNHMQQLCMLQKIVERCAIIAKRQHSPNKAVGHNLALKCSP